MDEGKNLLDIKDYRGKRIIFTKEKWKEKSIQHTELRNKEFLKSIKKAIENPTEVWEDYGSKKRKCYYWRYGINIYVKVVILEVGNPYNVITAYKINKIKEKTYHNLKQIK
jgi:hypothetical protein